MALDLISGDQRGLAVRWIGTVQAAEVLTANLR